MIKISSKPRGICSPVRVPLAKTVMGLRSFVKSEVPELQTPGAKLPVGQRLKREPQIISKLERYRKMNMSRMQDIGGCRAILPGGADQVAGVLARIENRWDVIDVHDYAAKPQPTGLTPTASSTSLPAINSPNASTPPRRTSRDRTTTSAQQRRGGGVAESAAGRAGLSDRP